MRDVFITAIILVSLPFIFRMPHFGILLWSWIGYMNPHRMTWGFAYSLPFAQLVAVTLMLALLFNTSEKKRIPVDSTLLVWGAFLFWMAITTAFAIYPGDAFVQYTKILKIQLVTLFTLMLMSDQKRINQLIYVIVFSIGFFSVKGGIFTILTGGSSRVWGPPGGFIEENNSLALATLMVIPLMVFIYQKSREKWVRYGMAFSIVVSMASALGSQSRGALLAMLAVMGFFWLKTKNKIVTGMGIVLLAGLGFAFMPDSWHERMGTIQSYEEDSSAMGRINAWVYAINAANARFTGAGLESWSASTFARWAPVPEDVHAAHSIYFSVLADHGWLGLVLFLSIITLSWLKLGKIMRRCKAEPEYQDQFLLARMLQVSFVAYLSGGAFLSLAYFDLPWHLYAITLLMADQTKHLDEKRKQLSAGRRNGGAAGSKLRGIGGPVRER